MNVLTDAGFEYGTGWQFANAAERVEDPSGAHSGTYYCRLKWETGWFSYGTAQQLNLSLAPRRVYQVGLWCRSVGTGHEALRVSIDTGDGVYTTQATRADSVDGWTWWDCGRFTAVGGTGRIELRCLNDSSDGDGWDVDDVVVEDEAEVKTAALWNALLADLRDIKTENGFDITLNTVYDRVVARNQRRFPSTMPSGGGGGEAETVGAQESAAVQTFDLDVMVKSENRFLDLLYACDSIRNAVERSSSHLAAVAGVENVDGSEWEFDQETNEASGQHGAARVSVRVTYEYRRGSV